MNITLKKKHKQCEIVNSKIWMLVLLKSIISNYLLLKNTIKGKIDSIFKHNVRKLNLE